MCNVLELLFIILYTTYAAVYLFSFVGNHLMIIQLSQYYDVICGSDIIIYK